MCANAVGCMCAPPNCYVNPVGAASINKPFFSGTRTLVVSNVIRAPGDMTYPGPLLYVCTRCWIYVRFIRQLNEPCWGCRHLQAMGFEL